MVDASLIWTSRASPRIGSPPPFLTIPPERPGWSTEPGAGTRSIPSKGFLAAIFDAPANVGIGAARSALEQAWQAVDDGQMNSNLLETVRLLMRHAHRAQGGGASPSMLLVLVRGSDIAWSSSNGCRLFLCRAEGIFVDLTRDGASPQGQARLNPGDVLILGNAALARQTTIIGQSGAIENITEDNADGWLESLAGAVDDDAAITFCMIGVRALLPATTTTRTDADATAGHSVASESAREVVEMRAGLTRQPPGKQAGATIYPAGATQAESTRGRPRGSIVAIALLAALLSLGTISVFLREANGNVAPAELTTVEADSLGLSGDPRSTAEPIASPTEAASGDAAAAATSETTAVPTMTQAPETATIAPATPTIVTATPIPTSPAVTFGTFIYPRLVDDTGYNNSLEFLTTLFGQPTAEDPAYESYVNDYVDANPDARCPSGQPIWFCLGGRTIPDLVPALPWVALTGEITAASDGRLELRSGTQIYAITEVQELVSTGTLTTGDRLSVVGRVDGLTWDSAAASGVRVEHDGEAIPVMASFVRLVPEDGPPSEWQRLASSSRDSRETERPVWLYSSDGDLITELIEPLAEAAEALTQGNVLIQGTLAQTTSASPRIAIQAVYILDITRNRYLCSYGELPDATCP